MKWAAALMAFALAACQTPAPSSELSQPTSVPPYPGGNRPENLIEQRDESLEREAEEPFRTGAYCTPLGDWCVLTPPGAEDIHLRLPNGSWITRPAFEQRAETWPILFRLHRSQRVLIGFTFERRQNLPDRSTASSELRLYETGADGNLTEAARLLLVTYIDAGGVQRELRSETQFSESESETLILTVRTSAYRTTPTDQGGDGVAALDEACSYTRVLSRTAAGRYEFDASPPDCPDYLP